MPNDVDAGEVAGTAKAGGGVTWARLLNRQRSIFWESTSVVGGLSAAPHGPHLLVLRASVILPALSDLPGSNRYLNIERWHLWD